jgi:hypothetical protein
VYIPAASGQTTPGQTTVGAAGPAAGTQTLQALVSVQAGTPSQINGANGSGFKSGIMAPPSIDSSGKPRDGSGTPAADEATGRGAVVSAAVGVPTQAALLASLPCDLRAVDAALNNLLSEVDELSGDLAGWLGIPSLPRWSIVAAGVIACAVGGQQMQRARNRRSLLEESESESLSRMFTRWQGLAVNGGL